MSYYTRTVSVFTLLIFFYLFINHAVFSQQPPQPTAKYCGLPCADFPVGQPTPPDIDKALCCHYGQPDLTCKTIGGKNYCVKFPNRSGSTPADFCIEPTLTPTPPADNSILGAIRKGGYVIYFRHAHTDWSQNDRELIWIRDVLRDRNNLSLFDQCNRQRLLSTSGQDEARSIGNTFRRLNIPVGEVFTSQWCRTRETANLAFNKATPVNDKIWDTGYLPQSEKDQYRDKLKEMFKQIP